MADVLARAMNAVLVTLEPGSLVAADPVGDTLWCAIHALNLRDITYDREHAAHFGYDSVPDELRQPVSLHSAANILRIPYATIWRKARKLEARGLLQRRDKGWIVPENILAVEAVNQPFQRAAGFFVRKLQELEQTGLDQQRIANLYIDQRPALAGVGNG